jgi:hypothetical protein
MLDFFAPHFLECVICGTTVKATDSGLCNRHKYDEQFTPVPSRDYERRCAIIDLNGPILKCDPICLYGECTLNMSDPYGCGGCCGCRGGCQVDYENWQTAPFTWEGDNA